MPEMTQDIRQAVADLRAQVQRARDTDTSTMALPVDHIAALLDAYDDTVTALREAGRFMEESERSNASCN